MSTINRLLELLNNYNNIQLREILDKCNLQLIDWKNLLFDIINYFLETRPDAPYEIPYEIDCNSITESLKEKYPNISLKDTKVKPKNLNRYLDLIKGKLKEILLTAVRQKFKLPPLEMFE